MKVWKIFLVTSTAMILPLALVSVGYAQELNCWGLRSARIDKEKQTEYSSPNSCPDNEEFEEPKDDSNRQGDNEPNDYNSAHKS